MKNSNIYFVIAVSFIVTNVVQMINDIGTKSDVKTYTWELPVECFILLSGMFFLGYMARKKEK